MKTVFLIFNSMSGVFSPKSRSNDSLLKDINNSVKELNYIDSFNDKQNIQNDTYIILKDFKNAVNEKQLTFL